ncbi:MAG TPA: sigma-70 family RNA polymerase sigma factor [Planctomycetota bacterium]|nr:sigma-70 family RNA polymerase sigma factor [Planctomycetota bacterium]
MSTDVAAPAPVATMGLAEALGRLAASKDAAAWETVVTKQAAEIHALAFRLLRDRSLAEDVVQETLLQIRDHAAKFSPPPLEPDRGARNWILKIAANTALQLARSRKRALAREEEKAREASVAMMAKPSGTTEQLEAVRDAVDALPDHERVSVLLHFFAGLEYRELAAQLGVPVGTAKARVSRGVERLRERLAPAGLAVAAPNLPQLIAEAPLTGGEIASEAAPAAEQFVKWNALLNAPQSATVSAFGSAVTSTLSQAGLQVIAPVLITVASAVAFGAWWGLPSMPVDDPIAVAIGRLRGGSIETRERAARELAAYGYIAKRQIRAALAQETDRLTALELSWLLKERVRCGEAAWRTNVLPEPPVSAIAQTRCIRVGERLIFWTYAQPNTVFCLDVATGALLWQHTCEKGSIFQEDSIVAMSHHTIVVRSRGGLVATLQEDGTVRQKLVDLLTALDLETGQQRWAHSLLEPRAYAYIALSAGETLVYNRHFPPELVWVEVDSGRTIATRQLPNNHMFLTNFDARLSPSTDLFVTTPNQGTSGINLKTNTVFTRLDTRPTAIKAIDGRIIVTHPSALEAYERALRPARLWTVTVPEEQKSSWHPLPQWWHDNFLFCHNPYKQVGFCVDLRNGRVLWAADDVAEFAGTSGDRVLVKKWARGRMPPASHRNVPYYQALDLKTGQRRPLYPRGPESYMLREPLSVFVNDRVYECASTNVSDQPPAEEQIADWKLATMSWSPRFTPGPDALLCKDASSGRVLWSVPVAGPSSLVPLGGFMIVASIDGEVRCIRIVGDDKK